MEAQPEFWGCVISQDKDAGNHQLGQNFFQSPSVCPISCWFIICQNHFTFVPPWWIVLLIWHLFQKLGESFPALCSHVSKAIVRRFHLHAKNERLKRLWVSQSAKVARIIILRPEIRCLIYCVGKKSFSGLIMTNPSAFEKRTLRQAVMEMTVCTGLSDLVQRATIRVTRGCVGKVRMKHEARQSTRDKEYWCQGDDHQWNSVHTCV